MVESDFARMDLKILQALSTRRFVEVVLKVET